MSTGSGIRLTSVAVLACAALLVSVAPAVAKTETVSANGVNAQLSYVKKGPRDFRDVRISIARGGARPVDEPGPQVDGGVCSRYCDLAPLNASIGEDERSIRLVNLDRDAELEVLVDFFSGGVSCCVVSRIYDLRSGPARYARIDRDWQTGGHSGARDLDDDGRAEFLSSDGRFRSRFGCGACTPEPVRVLALREGRIVDVTRRYRGRVRRDLAGLRRLYRKRGRRDPLASRGVMAALVAERYVLGQPRLARRALSRALDRGDFRAPRGVSLSGRGYVRVLLRFLRRAGYRG